MRDAIPHTIINELLDLLSRHIPRNHTTFSLRLKSLLQFRSRLSDPSVVASLLLFQESEAFKNYFVFRREPSTLDLSPNPSDSVLAYPNIHALFYDTPQNLDRGYHFYRKFSLSL